VQTGHFAPRYRHQTYLTTCLPVVNPVSVERGWHNPSRNWRCVIPSMLMATDQKPPPTFHEEFAVPLRSRPAGQDFGSLISESAGMVGE